MRLALYQPDIPQNLGAAIRLAACFGTPLDVIEPCGFPLTERSLKRAALDYGEKALVERHASFAAFLGAEARSEGRLLLGRESAGSSPEVYAAAGTSVRIPMAAGLRSLNVVTAGAVALSEAMRQSGLWRNL